MPFNIRDLIRRHFFITQTDLGNLEGDFRVAHLGSEIRQGILYMTIISLGILLMLLVDAMFLKRYPRLLMLMLVYRVGFVFVSILIGLLAIRIKRVRDYDNLAFAWMLLTVIFILLVNFTRPVNYISTSFDVIVPFTIYVFSPLKIKKTFAIAAGFSLGAIYIDYLHKVGLAPAILSVATMAQLVVHVLGLNLTLQLQTYRRKSYKAFIDEKNAKEMVAYLANIDPLTKSLTRRQFLSIAESEFKRFARYRRPLSILILDADRFKLINDTYGHHAGDLALRSLSLVAMEQKRAQDTFGRLGGEEFGLLMPETTLENALVVAERIRKVWEQSPINLDGELIRSTMSIGVAEAVEADQAIENVLRRADQMLYKAKESGRNRVVSE